jgi:pullulanase
MKNTLIVLLIIMISLVCLAPEKGESTDTPVSDIISKSYTVHYINTSWDEADIHFTVDNNPDGWTPPPGVKMTHLGNGHYIYTIITSSDSQTVTMAFHKHGGDNSPSNWDSQGGQNYTSGATEFWIWDTKIYDVDPLKKNEPQTVKFHYHRDDGNYSGWGIQLRGEGLEESDMNIIIPNNPHTIWTSPLLFDKIDDFGRYTRINISDSSKKLYFIIRSGNLIDGEQERSVIPSHVDNEIWLLEGNPTIFTAKPSLESQPETPQSVTIHYQRKDGNYTGWGLHLWGHGLADSEKATVVDGVPSTLWAEPRQFEGADDFGRYGKIKLSDAGKVLNFLIHKGSTKDISQDRGFVPSQAQEIWLIQGDPVIYPEKPQSQEQIAVIHYYREDGNYSGWGLHLWGTGLHPEERTSWTVPRQFNNEDDYGKYIRIKVINPAEPLNFIIHKGNEKDTSIDRSFMPSDNREIWLKQGDTTVYFTKPSIDRPQKVRIHYHRKDQAYSGWGLHLWGSALKPDEKTIWPSAREFTSSDGYGVYADISIKDFSEKMGVIVHKKGDKDVQSSLFSPENYKESGMWLIQGVSAVFTSKEEALHAGSKVYDARARWVSLQMIGWITPAASTHKFTLHHDREGDIIFDQETGVIKVNGNEDTGIQLTFTGDFSHEEPAFYQKFAYLRNHGFSKITAPFTDEQARNIFKNHVVIAKREQSGRVVDATAVLKAGVIDELMAYEENDLGVTFTNGIPTVKLWAPTAQAVQVHVYKDSQSNQEIPGSPLAMEKGEQGVWMHTGDPSWKDKFYLYEIDVFMRTQGRIVTNISTDPYSVSLSMNSTRSQIVDLNDSALKPPGWDSHQIQNHFPLEAPEDMTIYELHLRDFSILDESVPTPYRGTFKAFTISDSSGMKHLETLAQAGLTHIHLLPVNDIGTINENRDERIELTDPIEKIDPDSPEAGKTIFEVLENLPADSSGQQALIAKLRQYDGFNWGYDPLHYMVPEGSYSTNPDGSARIMEFREMVMALHNRGLRVVPDVVFNHTSDSVLEKIVPDYYYRMNHEGEITHDSCCPDTASETKMFQKLMVDSLVTWARHYKVDAFRFDLLSFHTKESIRAVRQALDQLTLEKDGIEGKNIYLYGEGWQFGSLNWLLPAESMHQYGAVALGLGVGTFNDRIRDSVKGKGQNPDELFIDDAFITDKTFNRDQVLSGLRGTLNDWDNGYVNDPQESINYLTAHDKCTLWDQITAKVGIFADQDRLTRIQQLGIGLIALSQGIPFFHAGSGILRSKSGDENSYDSGDWFNRVEFTYAANNWKKGLPPGWQHENKEAWDRWKKRFNRITIAHDDHINAAFEHFQDMLKIRKSSPLFRLRTKSDIQRRLFFPGTINNDTGSFDSRMIVVKIVDFPEPDLDPDKEIVWILFNTSWDTWIHFTDDDIKRPNFQLHPVLQNTENRLLKELLDGCCRGAALRTAFTNLSEGRISVPPQSTVVYYSE